MNENNEKEKQGLTEMELRKYALKKAIEWLDCIGRPVTLKLPLKLADVFFMYMTTGKIMDWSPWDDQ